MQNALLGMFEEAGYMPHVVSELQLYSEVLYLVRAGLGYTIAPELSWLDDVNGLAVKPISDVQRGATSTRSFPRAPRLRRPPWSSSSS